MARHNRLRHTNGERSANAGHFAFPRPLSPIHIAAIVAILAATFLAVQQYAPVGGKSAPPAPALLTKELGSQRSSALLVTNQARPSTTLSTRDGLHAGFELFPVVILTSAGVNISSIGLGWKLKGGGSGSKLQLELGDSSFPASYATTPALAAAAVTTGETDGGKKVLDLSRPIRAGPHGDPGMTFDGSVFFKAGGVAAGFRILVTGSELRGA
jgi:hypothetical protein